MKNYVGVKAVQAEPMTLLTYNTRTSIPDTRVQMLRAGDPLPHACADVSNLGYLVVYPDGHDMWLPKESFERSYNLIEEPLSGPNPKDDSYEAFREYMLKEATDRGSEFVMPETALVMLYEAYKHGKEIVEFVGLRGE